MHIFAGIFYNFLDHIFILGVIQLNGANGKNGADCKLTWVPPGGAWFQTGWHCSAPAQCQRTAWRNAAHLYFSCGFSKNTSTLVMPSGVIRSSRSDTLSSTWTHRHRNQQRLLSISKWFCCCMDHLLEKTLLDMLSTERCLREPRRSEVQTLKTGVEHLNNIGQQSDISV